VLADPLLPLLPLVAPVPAGDAPAVAVPAAAVVPAPLVDVAPAAVPAAPAPVPAARAEPAAPAVTPATATAPAAADLTAAAAPVAAAPAAVLPEAVLPAGPALPPADAPAPEPATAEPTPQADPPVAPSATATLSTDTGTTSEQGAPRDPAGAPPRADAPAASAPSAPPAQAAIAPSPVAGPPLAPRATLLHQAPRAVAQVLHVAQERGISHAKLNLRPVELGGIEIRLQSSAAGVTAQVVADSPEAARLLQHAADDLRRSLERQDVTLLSLDVSTAGDGRSDGSAGASADLAGDRARHFAAFDGGREAAEADDAPAVVETVVLADGLHIDVLA
jgi:flagellar hook-length control protein FliK